MRTIAGLLLLLGMVARSRFRLGGAYWSWRASTAMGADPLPFPARARAVLEYARWLERMRSLSR